MTDASNIPPPKDRDKRKNLGQAVARYLKQVGRKATPTHNNDRRHDRELEQKLKRMSPEDVDALMRDDDI